jgi:signal transduction histidine kinase
MGATEDREARLRRRAEELEAALKVRDELLSVAAHELKTPLGAMRLYVDELLRLLQQGTLTAEQLAKRLQQAQQQVERLDTLLDNLLDFSRVRSGRLSLVLEPIELGSLAAGVCERLRPAFAREGRTLDVYAPEPVRGDWDRLRLEQVLTNLISNALKHARRSPVKVSVLTLADGRASLAVADQGPGIRQDERERIFERFMQLPSTGGGLGLGLWIVSQIVQALGGEIRIESEPGAGACFIVDLPPQAQPPEAT